MTEQIKLRVNELENIIADAQAELNQIKKQCVHPSYYIGWYSWRMGDMSVSRICATCQSQLPGLTEKEKKDFYFKENKRNQETFKIHYPNKKWDKKWEYS